MGERFKRILIAIALGLLVALASNRLQQEFVHLGIRPESTYLEDLIIGSVAGLCAYGWASLLAERHSRQSLAARLRQEGALRERSRIACEIHDTLAQGFAGMILNLEAADELLAEDPEAQELCERALRIGRESLAEARSLLLDLHPLTHERESLRGAIASLVRRMTEGVGPQVDCFIDEISCQLSPETERDIIQIIREALNNVVKHASAKKARVALRANGNQLHLCVEDDGRGFLPGDPFIVQGFGLTSMRERVRNLGGLLWVYSQPGLGTQVVAFIPILGQEEAGSMPCERPVPFESSSLMTIRSCERDSEQS